MMIGAILAGTCLLLLACYPLLATRIRAWRCEHEYRTAKRSKFEYGSGRWRRYGAYTSHECVRCGRVASHTDVEWTDWHLTDSWL